MAYLEDPGSREQGDTDEYPHRSCSCMCAFSAWPVPAAVAAMAGGDIQPARIPATDIPGPTAPRASKARGCARACRAWSWRRREKQRPVHHDVQDPGQHQDPAVLATRTCARASYSPGPVLRLRRAGDESQLKLLPAGSHYTEPAGMNHFAETRDEPVIAECTASDPPARPSSTRTMTRAGNRDRSCATPSSDRTGTPQQST